MARKFPKAFHHRHDPESILKRLREGAKHSYLKDFVYGSIDGTITTFAVVSGVVGANLPSKAILILGAANLLADGFSMAAGNYASTKTENHERELLREFENHEIDRFPEGETEEVRHILERKGYKGNLLEQNVAFITSDRKLWVDMMLTEEYGIIGAPRSAMKAAVMTFIAFGIFGSIPLIAYIFKLERPFFWSSLLTGLSFVLIGSFKSLWTVENSFVSAIKTLAVGAAASVIAYYAGFFLRNVAGS